MNSPQQSLMASPRHPDDNWSPRGRGLDKGEAGGEDGDGDGDMGEGSGAENAESKISREAPDVPVFSRSASCITLSQSEIGFGCL